MAEVQKFQEIVLGLRDDLSNLESLYWILYSKLINNPYLQGFTYPTTASETREWIFDVFLDKVYDIDFKLTKFLNDISLGVLSKKASIDEIQKVINEIIYDKKGMGSSNTYQKVEVLRNSVSMYRHSVDVVLDAVRQCMYETNWANMQRVDLTDYLFTRTRRKYITAREELETAKQMTKNGKYEEVLNHIRPALELALKERFGFQRFKNFWNFIEVAEKLNFPLPAFNMFYFYYGEGSGRLHAGKLNNPFECQIALTFASNFIDKLELVSITQEEIDNFKKNCPFVE
jgi:hypothetical protein